MTPEQFKELMQQIRGMPTPIATPQIRSPLYKTLPIPTGMKSLIGLLGFAVTGYLQSRGAPLSGELSQYQPIIDALMWVFGTIGGVGVLAKADRFIRIALLVLAYAPQVVSLLEELQRQIPRQQQ